MEANLFRLNEVDLLLLKNFELYSAGLLRFARRDDGKRETGEDGIRGPTSVVVSKTKWLKVMFMQVKRSDLEQRRKTTFI